MLPRYETIFRLRVRAVHVVIVFRKTKAVNFGISYSSLKLLRRFQFTVYILIKSKVKILTIYLRQQQIDYNFFFIWY